MKLRQSRKIIENLAHPTLSLNYKYSTIREARLIRQNYISRCDHKDWNYTTNKCNECGIFQKTLYKRSINES